MTNNVKDGAFFLREREIERERGEEKIRKYFYLNSADLNLNDNNSNFGVCFR